MEFKSKKNIAEFGEVFTPPEIVNMMVSIAKTELQTWGVVEDPACGTGNILVGVLNYKLDQHQDPVCAISQIYGRDIQETSVTECRSRLLSVIESRCDLSDDQRREISAILKKNIRCADFFQDSKQRPGE